MTLQKMRLVDWLDDLCVRFIINLPHEELQSVERICFQIEEAQWFYEDFIRPLDPSLPSMNLRRFALLMFQHCPLSSSYSELHHTQAYEDFLAYKTRVPVRGAIMLNDDMTHAVLVKGWKKGAKWSFPRGKINKDEADLDCAIREVWEETGYDLKGAGLVAPDEQMKKIPVSMREQDMMLYVFRGVPMDTYFEPRTRKEISKIDWYKLTDLPTIKRKNQVQQGVGQDLIKENSFYMVAPFLGPLKGWIKQQQRLDKRAAKAGPQPAAPVATGVTDTEEVEMDIGDTTADEALVPDAQPADGNFADLVARLGRGHRSSDALPEVSAEPQPPQNFDPAAELKRLLSVGGGMSQQTPTVEAPAAPQDLQANTLLSLFRGNNQPPPPPMPHTPFDQFIPPPTQPHSPHGQHHPRPPYPDQMPPPPMFPIHPQHNLPFRGPPPHGPPHMPPQHLNGMHMPGPRSFMPPPPPRQMNAAYAPRPPPIQQSFNQEAPRPYHRTGDPQFGEPSQLPSYQGPSIPPAHNLPPPKLSAHTQGLLNAFKSQEKPATPQQPPSQPAQSSQTTPRMQQPPSLQRSFDSFVSPKILRADMYAPSPPPFQSPPPNANFQPAQPKPRNAHQDSLLSLFRSPSVPAATPPPVKAADPVELSAQPTTPGHAQLPIATQEAAPPRPDIRIKPNLLDAFSQSRKPDLTSATVSGPVNVPDFETVKKSTHLVDANGHSRGPSPAEWNHAPPPMFIPQQILRREGTGTIKMSPTEIGNTSRTASPKSTSNVTTPQATVFKPQILKRPQQNASPVPPPALAPQPANDFLKGRNSPQVPPGPGPLPPAPAVQHAFDRRGDASKDHTNTLLSLFGKPASVVGSPGPVSKSPLPPHGLANPPPGLSTLPAKSPLSLPKSPIPPARSPHPPTPKSVMSGVISPVSPLPLVGSTSGSPAHLASRSRISSIGDTMAPGLIMPKDLIPTSDPSSTAALAHRNGNVSAEEGYASAGSAGISEGVGLGAMAKGKTKAKAEGDGKSPVDKTFLLGFLEDVARRGR